MSSAANIPVEDVEATEATEAPSAALADLTLKPGNAVLSRSEAEQLAVQLAARLAACQCSAATHQVVPSGRTLARLVELVPALLFSLRARVGHRATLGSWCWTV